MSYIRLLKYPGSKTTMLPDIAKIFEESGKTIFVDVFGGSALVSLNIRAGKTVYNDINAETVNILEVLRDRPHQLFEFLDKFTDILEHKFSPGSGREYNEVFRRNWRKILNDTERDHNSTGYNEKTAMAVKSLIQYNLSFGGMGDTYGTAREKSPYKVFLKMCRNIRSAADAVKGWIIESSDFRELISKHDSRDVFFYLDPPYPGKDWYSGTFARDDFVELKNAMDSMIGSYLLNLDLEDRKLREIFGEPDFVRTYPNRNVHPSIMKGSPRRKMFYTNVQTEYGK